MNKKNKFGRSQERILLLTNQYLYNIKDSSQVQRKIAVEDIKCVTKCIKQGSGAFIIHIRKQYDYQYDSNHRDDIVDACKWVYFTTNNGNLPMYGVDGKIDNFATTKKHISNGEEIPQDEHFRLRDEDKYSPVEK